MPSGNVQDQHILQLIYVLHLVQILLTTDQFTCKKKEEGCDEDGRENTGKIFKSMKITLVNFGQDYKTFEINCRSTMFVLLNNLFGPIFRQFFTLLNCHQNSDANEERAKETAPILHLLQLVREAVGFASEGDGSEGLDAALVWQDLKEATLPFLRCAALFYSHLTSTPGPQVRFPESEYIE